MIVKPGDTVIVPMREKLSDYDVAELKEQLIKVAPSVRWGIIAGSTMTHALVLEGVSGSDGDER